MLPARLIFSGALCAAMSFLFSIPAHAIIDSDGDRLSDIWELQYGLSTTWNDYESHNDDWDGDGWGLLKEAIAGTDPYSAAMPAGLIAAEITQTATPGTFSVSWPTLVGKQYQLVVSPDLTENSWVPVGAPIVGEGTPIQIGIEADLEASDKLFWRVEISDVDSDEDGLSDFEEGLIGTNPQSSDTDGDGISDAGEHEAGTSPTNPEYMPTIEWFLMTGNSEQGVTKEDTRTFTIPRGLSRVLVVATQSDEYPYYTGQQSDFDDTLSWKIVPSVGANIEDEIHVNERHEDWEIDEVSGHFFNGLAPAHYEKVKVIHAPWDADVTVTVTLKATNVSDSALPSRVGVALLPLRIAPDANMIGVIGDRIPSNKGIGGERHFVTPKKTTELPQDYVNLKVFGLAESWITPNDPNQLLEWVPGVGEAGEGGHNTWRVKRDTAGKNVVKIRTLQEYGEEEAYKYNVWTVWADKSVTQTGTGVFGRASNTTIDGTTSMSAGWLTDNRWLFRFTIQPSAIINDPEDWPDFRGNFSTPPPGDISEFTGLPLSLGANKKWDVARRVEERILNPGLKPQGKFAAGSGSIYNSQPSADSIAVPLPSNPVIGNDDSDVSDEDNAPYSVSTTEYLEHAIGQITSRDRPNIWMPEVGSSDGDTIEERCNFSEFARLEIGEKWYRISDYLDWRFVLKVKMVSGEWTNDGCETAEGH